MYVRSTPWTGNVDLLKFVVLKPETYPKEIVCDVSKGTTGR